MNQKSIYRLYFENRYTAEVLAHNEQHAELVACVASVRRAATACEYVRPAAMSDVAQVLPFSRFIHRS